MTLEAGYYAALNRVLVPLARTGLFAPRPVGLIELATTGWRTGKTHRTPVLAAALGGQLLVSTVRGRRSHWVRNLERTPEAAYWTGDVEHLIRAFVVAPGRVPREPGDIDARLHGVLAGAAELSGCAFALLTPEER